MAKSMGCSCREPGLGPQYSHGGSQLSLIPDAGDPVPSSQFLRYQSICSAHAYTQTKHSEHFKKSFSTVHVRTNFLSSFQSNDILQESECKSVDLTYLLASKTVKVCQTGNNAILLKFW